METTLTSDQILERFAEASTLPGPKGERICHSFRNLKRSLLGLCGHSTNKSTREIAEALYSINVAQTVDDGRTMVPLLSQTYNVIGQELSDLIGGPLGRSLGDSWLSGYLTFEKNAERDTWKVRKHYFVP